MATPQETITTVSGRRCTRSRARTAATSTIATEIAQAAEAIETEVASPATTAEVQEVETSAAAEPPPPQPSSNEPEPTAVESPPQEAERPVDIPPATEADNPVSSVASASSAPRANVEPTPPVAAAPFPGAVVSPEASGTDAATPSSVTSRAPATASATRSGPGNVAVTSASVLSSISSPSTSPLASSVQGTPDLSQQSLQPNPGPVPSSTDLPPGGDDGIIGPESDQDVGPGLTISNTGNANVGGIVGGVVGGFAVVALISVLLFLCLRRRKSRDTFARWQKRLNEEKEDEPGLVEKLRAVPANLGAIPARVGVFFAKLKSEKPSPDPSPYNRQSLRSSVSSVYSARANRRSQSMSEPPSRLRQHLRGLGGRFGDRMPSLKRSRTLLHQKQDSLVVGEKSPFPGIVDDPVLRNGNGIDPFADPAPPGPSVDTPKSQKDLDGLRDQQRPPISPKPVAFSNRRSRDPFASILDELEEKRGNSTPDWLRDTSHKRTQSATTALRSHPPSTYTASIYTTADSPFWDPSDAPPVPQQPLPPNPPKRPMNSYTAGLPAFNATSSTTSRESTGSFYFGEPGPSRPTTNMFSDVSVSALPRVGGRQSDPFDLDRPEVLGIGQVGGRQVRASMTRQNSRTKRTSSVPNWVNLDDGHYERVSAVPGPLRNPSVKK